jgi:hypothetical protein
MSLALSGDLDWKIGADLSALTKAAKLPGNIKADIANKSSLKAYIAIPDYSFDIGKDEIISYGEGSPECFWDIKEPTLQRTHQLKFGIVFKVPKGTRSIELTGLVIVEPSKRWLASKLRHVFEYLSQSDQALIQGRDEERKGKENLLFGDHEYWQLVLPL